jgi:hypothetical protein
MSLTELDSTVGEVDPIPGNIFKRFLKVGFGWVMLCYPCVDGLHAQATFCFYTPRKARLVKAKSSSTIDTI